MRARLTGAIAFAALSVVQPCARAQSADRIRVHLEGADDAILQRADNDEWVDVCAAPCNVRVSARDVYRVHGAHMRPTDPFSLDAKVDGTESIFVKPTSRAAHAEGVLLATFGVLGSIAGTFVTLIGFAPISCVDEGPNNVQCSGGNRSDIPLGIGIVVVSIAATVAGVVIVNQHTKSTLRQQELTGMRVRWFAGDVSPMREGSLDLAPNLTSAGAVMVTPIVTVSF